MRRRTSSDLSARARKLAERTGISYAAALAALRAPQSAQAPASPSASTGLPELDLLLGPQRPGALTVLAARTGAGTTALLLTIARHTARAGTPVILAESQSSLRTTRQMLLTAEAGRVGESTIDSERELAHAAACLNEMPLHVISPTDGRGAVAHLRAAAAATGPALLLVDDLALGYSDVPYDAGKAADELAGLAQELHVAAIATAHLGAEADEAAKPCAEHLRYPAVLDHVDTLVLLHRPARTAPVKPSADLVTLYVDRRPGRSQGGHGGTTTALFQAAYHRMVPAGEA